MANEKNINKLLSLDKRINSFVQGYRQNVAIFANDSQEITYLLTNYLAQHKTPELIYIHTTTKYANKKDFLRSVIFTMLNEVISSEDTLDGLINKSISAFPLTANFIKEALQKPSVSILDILELINKFINESKRRCLFIVEDFVELKNMFPGCLKDFSKFIILQKNCMVVLTSACNKESHQMLANDFNLLFGDFEKINISESIFANDYGYIKDLTASINPSPFFLSFFVNTLGSNIVYYDVIKKYIFESYTPDEELAIISALENSLYYPETYFFQKFIKSIDFLKNNFKDSSGMMKVLLMIGDGYIRKKELFSLNICEPRELNVKLSKLVEINYIENLGDIYQIKDPLFGFWLSNVFKLLFCPSFCDQQKSKILFKNKIKQQIALFRHDFAKDKVNRIIDLISSFKDDSFKIGKTKYKLPLVNDTKIISYPEKKLHFIVGEGKEIIFAGVLDKDVGDTEVFDFIENAKSVKGKRVKKVIISLDRLTPTARLIAKNNKLFIWGAEEINDLLKVYNKPSMSVENRLANADTSPF